ncbi:MAG TPA: SBBP repeat-containing protein, partial [Gammaproteobacteria bacterium]
MTSHKQIKIRTGNQRAGRLTILLLQWMIFSVTPAVAFMQDRCDENPVAGQSCTHHDTSPVTPVFEANYGHMPLVFETNQGQVDPAIKFLARGHGYNLYLTSSEVVMALYQPLIMTGKNEPVQNPSVHLLRMNFLNANPDVRMIGGEGLPGKTHYLVGNDPKGWYSGIRHYKNARYRDIYPGVDLVFYGEQNKIEYDFVIEPGASYKKIRLGYEGMEGMSIDGEGNLVLHTPMGDLMQHAPYAYQIVDGKKIQVQANYVLQDETRVGFQVRDYDVSRTLIIDPVLSYSTYLGGSLSDTVTDIAVDNSGNAYITGYTLSADFDTASAMNTSAAGGIDIFISKISADGSSLVYSTYLGGTGNDLAYGIAVDTSAGSSGVVAVTGVTASADFPVVSAIQPVYGGSSDGFVAKINAAGSAIDYSTYLGGAGSDEAHDIAFNIYSQAYITGFTSSADFPVISGFQTTRSSSVDAFVSKINAAGTAFVFSSYLGGRNGNGDDYGYAVAVDDNDNAYVAGKTAATSFPTVSALQEVFGGGATDAFVAKIHPLGLSVIYATYLGGTGDDVANGIAVDDNENVYVAGGTSSAGFPIVFGGLDSICGTDGNCNNKYDAFVVKFS